MSALTPHPFTVNPIRTRDDLQDALVSLLDSLALFTSPGGALLKLGHTATHYDERAAQLEGFSRPLWGVASLLAGGGSYDGVQRWIDGFKNGTDPLSEEFWGYTRGRDQRMVEMAAMGYTLSVAREHIWDKLGEEGTKNLSTWLAGINGKEMPNTNWLWFRVFANLGLSKVGSPYSKDQLKADLDHLDTFYLGDGWSRDGPPGVRQLDYYSGSFAIQFAQLIYSKLAEKDDPERCEEYRDRARKYALDFVRYFDAEGRAIPFGRSMTYRFAMASFWGALAFADVLPPAPLDNWGVIKGLLLRNIRWWASQGSAILSPQGILTIGYAYPSTYATENYNSPGSPYWAFKAFVPLALPSTHPFWSTPELPHPIYANPSLPRSVALHHPGHIMSHHTSHAFLLSSGQACHYPLRHGAEKYGKLAYSAAFGYAVPTGALGLDQAAPDSTIALSEDSGESWRVRREVKEAAIEGTPEEGGPWLRAVWAPWKDTEVETWLVPPQEGTPHWYLRVHRISSPRDLRVSDAGFSIYGQGADGRALAPAADLLMSLDVTEGTRVYGHAAILKSSAGVSGVLDLIPPEKKQQPRDGQVLPLDANANIIFSRSAMPTLVDEHAGEANRDRWLVTGVFAMVGKDITGAQVAKEWSKLPKLPKGIERLLSGG
ncbi:hypothetical protein BOTBODRAFT_163974 [Botryobasidium botryosum FD-172 SS1]|uniref:DUF2264 domain-containing protein n=1 Tax=Botryobasidium botryosum (strain FD-172 SS1) TaxID=930990 RepID=A0A067MEY0_BOTB1|nr:hypothetical protein BOTBODRAFT_163974 [Botryobasidium botryosum FD-172 SS1]